MKNSILLNILIIIVLLILASCTVPNQPSGVGGAVVVPTTSNPTPFEELDAMKESVLSTQAVDSYVVLITPLNQVSGTWNSMHNPGASVVGCYKLTLQSDDNVLLELRHEEYKSSPEARSDTILSISNDKLSELLDSSPNPGDSVVGRYRMELLPSDEVMIRLWSERCE